MTTEPTVRFDDRFSDPSASATPWAEAARVLEEAELYWITTVRVADDATLQVLADAIEAKYGSFWHVDVNDGMSSPSGAGGVDGAVVFRVEPSKVMAFAKGPHGQTSYRFD